MKNIKFALALLLIPLSLLAITPGELIPPLTALHLYPNHGGGGSTIVTGTSPILVNPISGGYNVSCPTCSTSNNNPLSIYFQQDLPNADASMSIGGLYINRTGLSPINPTYSLPQGGSSIIPAGSIITYINVGSNIPTITASGPDRMSIDGVRYTRIRPQLGPSGNQNYSVSFIRIGSSDWVLTLNGPFTGSLNAS
jgi:hypothetical protein